ncbi:hypothetical protein JK628_01160 [Shewanella sp. KX20019]|uniref:hypothetical protein n=1 Tax=Shewanella sp. KX20019 TaxID=2803864 RepID=UPI0019281DD7|nr:hypothetical protein [Shewanella sp. KX20019]QQX80521.1 hypothetical protein JK628_01160 [Shewanella sp. KX20019]
MLKGISDSLQVQQRSQTVAPTTSMQQPVKEQTKTNVARIPSHRLESYNKWARVTQGQHKISAQQVAEQGLQQVQALLKQLQNHSQQSIKADSSDSVNQALQIQQKLAGLDISYQGTQLVDHQLNLVSVQRPLAKYSFSLKSVDLTAINSRDEHVNMHIGNETVRLLLPANAQPKELLQRLDSALKPVDIQVGKSKDGRVIFKSNKSQWQQVQAGILMTGQGQRLPAGDARTIKVNEELSWQDPREWRFNNPEALKQTLAKITKTRQRIDSQLQELNNSQRHVQQQLHQVNRQKETTLELDSTLDQIKNLMQPSPFSLQVTSLMAQANLSRTQVSALLI